VIAPALVADRIRTLPALPAAVARVHALAADPRSGPADFEALLRPDPALSANLLRLANSAHFAPRSRVETVRQAVAVLGLKRTSDLATGAAFAPLVPKRLPGYEVDAAAFWLHCAAVAVLAEKLAAEAGGAPDLTFTAGLLHDVGKLAVCAFVAGEASAIAARLRAGEAFAAAERGTLGLDHAEVGAVVALRWGLPPAVADVARWHHRPGDVPEGVDRRLVAVVHAADGLAHALGLGADRGELARALDPAAVEPLGIPVRRVERIAGEALEPIRELGRVFGVEGGGA
jgi:putative nucleotidyltransferase with HDIG domain